MTASFQGSLKISNHRHVGISINTAIATKCNQVEDVILALIHTPSRIQVVCRQSGPVSYQIKPFHHTKYTVNQINISSLSFILASCASDLESQARRKTSKKLILFVSVEQRLCKLPTPQLFLFSAWLSQNKNKKITSVSEA